MNPLQLRETTMATDTRRLIQLGKKRAVDSEEETMETMDMMLAKKRSADRKQWLEVEGDLAEIQQ
jgi:topoisomerase-4 subunit B